MSEDPLFKIGVEIFRMKRQIRTLWASVRELRSSGAAIRGDIDNLRRMGRSVTLGESGDSKAEEPPVCSDCGGPAQPGVGIEWSAKDEDWVDKSRPRPAERFEPLCLKCLAIRYTTPMDEEEAE